MTRETKDVVALVLVCTIGVFVLSTLAVVFVLALNGHALDDVWTSLFGLVVALVSALGGWLAGVNGIGKTQLGTKEEP